MRSRLLQGGCALIIAFTLAACKGRETGDSVSAPFLSDASAEAKEAVATPVSFQLTEDNFSKWEIAQRNLDRLPPAALAPNAPVTGNVIDRAIARLDGSARARKAIESAGLSVRDFVLETIALAQAVEAAGTGRSSIRSGIPAANFAFVERYRDRIREAGIEEGLALQSGDTAVTDPNTAAELARARADSAAEAAEIASDSLAGIRRDTASDTLRDSIPQ